MAFEITKLGELLVARVKFASKRLLRRVHNLVRAYVATLRERLVADVTFVWSLPSVSTLVCLEIA